MRTCVVLRPYKQALSALEIFNYYFHSPDHIDQAVPEANGADYLGNNAEDEAITIHKAQLVASSLVGFAR